MSRGILKRNTRDRRKEAEDNLFQIIEDALRGKSDAERDELMYEFIQYFNHTEGLEKGLNKYLNTVTGTNSLKRINTKVRFNDNITNKNRNKNRNNRMNSTRRQKSKTNKLI